MVPGRGRLHQQQHAGMVCADSAVCDDVPAQGLHLPAAPPDQERPTLKGVPVHPRDWALHHQLWVHRHPAGTVQADLGILDRWRRRLLGHKGSDLQHLFHDCLFAPHRRHLLPSPSRCDLERLHPGADEAIRLRPDGDGHSRDRVWSRESGFSGSGHQRSHL